MKRPFGPFTSVDAREKHIVDFVLETMRHSEMETIPDRERFKEMENLFEGIQDFGGDSENEEWMSDLFIHEISPMIREAAISAQQFIFERDEFINIKAGEHGNAEFARIMEKANRHYNKTMSFKRRFYEYAIAGCLYGFATWKVGVVGKLCYRPEVIIEELEKQRDEIMSNIEGEIENRDSYVVPDSLDIVTRNLGEAVDNILGKLQRGYAGPEIKAKKYFEFAPELRLMNPFNLFWKPDAEDINESPYMIERIYTKFFELHNDFEMGILDKSKKDKMLKARGLNNIGSGSVGASYESMKWRQRNQFSSNIRFFPDMELLNYYGPFLDARGDMIEENVHFVIGQGRHVLKDEVNQYWHQKPPYITAVFSRKPFKAIGAGIADNARDTQKLSNELWSTFMDMLRLDVHAPRTVNVDQLVDETEIDEGIKPGALIQVFGSADANKVFGTIPRATNVAPEVFQVVEKLALSGQKASSVNTMSANPASRARQTAKETASNDDRRIRSVTVLGAEIDENCIVPLVEMTNGIILQFGFDRTNLDLLRMKGVLSESEFDLVANMSPLQRFQEATRNYKLDVRGFRAVIEKNIFLQRFAEWLQQINQMPPEAQAKIDWARVITDGTEAYGMNANDWVRQNNPQDAAVEENVLIGQNRMVQVLPDDNHVLHLPVHYEGLLKGAVTPAALDHTRNHIKLALTQGAQVPPPPAEIAQSLGLPPPPTGPAQKQQGAAQRIEMQGQKSLPSELLQ